MHQLMDFAFLLRHENKEKQNTIEISGSYQRTGDIFEHESSCDTPIIDEALGTILK